MGLSLRPFITSHQDDDCFYDIRGVVTMIKDAKKKLLPLFDLSPEERKLAEATAAPALFGVALHQEILGLSDQAKAALFADEAGSEGLYSSELKRFKATLLDQLEALSVGDFLRSRLSGPDALELVGATTGLEVWWDRALTIFLRDEIVGTGAHLDEIVGGMDRLPLALADKLPTESIQLNTPVRAIRVEEDGVKVSIEQDGKQVQEEADYVLCTIPFSVLRQMPVEGVSLPKLKAIRNLTYASAAKVLLHCKTRFWETEKYRIFGGASLSDRISRATYYPSDRYTYALPSTPSDQGQGLHTTYATSEVSGKQGAEDPGPGVLIASYVWGQDARRLGSLPKEERARVVAEAVSRFHPELAGYEPGKEHPIVDDHASIFWDEYRWSYGAFSFLRSGDLPKFYADSVKPEGRLFFAGEHCSMDQAWIQGALMSSLTAVESIIED